MKRRLTLPKLDAMHAALEAALAGDGFNGGDFDRLKPKDFEAARDWVAQQIAKFEARQ
jgi:hypothetical protein